MEIDWELVSNTIKNYEQYPPDVRIAKYLWMQGVREADFARLKSSGKFKLWPEPIVLAIQNHLRDMERGFITEDILDRIPEPNI